MAGHFNVSEAEVEGPLRPQSENNKVLVRPQDTVFSSRDYSVTTDIYSLAKSPINVEVLKSYCQIYDPVEANFLVSGFINGFLLQYSGPREARDSKNLKSALAHPEVLEQKIHTEIAAGRVAGPFSVRPMANLIVSPLGLVPKKQAGEFRMIHHLSYPEGGSVNDYIDPNLASVQYTSFDEAIAMMQRLGQNCKLFKMDLKNAFRNLPINPHDFHLLGFSFKGKFYFDKALVFGASISCSIFERFARFLEFAIKTKMSSGELIHYLDDFLGGDTNHSTCKQNMQIFQQVMHELGVPLATEKTEGPSEILVFLGLLLNSRNMTVSIPQEKLEEIRQKIKHALSKEKITLKEMQSLIGSLNFCCRAIIMGRPFCRRLIDKTCGLTKPFHHLRVSKGIRQDLLMWLHFFEAHNGVSVFHDQAWLSNAEVQLFTDSAGGSGLGFGIFFQGHWCQASWPPEWHDSGITKDITILELFPIVAAMFIWGSRLRNKKIMFNCDNIAVVHIINKLSSKSEPVMCLIRVLTLRCLQLNVLVKACHVEGIKNVLCDALSRLQLRRFRELAPDADLNPAPVPSFLWSIFNAESAILSMLGHQKIHI